MQGNIFLSLMNIRKHEDSQNKEKEGISNSATTLKNKILCTLMLTETIILHDLIKSMLVNIHAKLNLVVMKLMHKLN